MQHTKEAIESENTLRYIGDIRYLTLNYDIHIFFIDTPACEVWIFLIVWGVNWKLKLVRYENRWSCYIDLILIATIWIAYSQKWSMCSALVSNPIPPCHHPPPHPTLCPYWVISIDSHLSVEPSHWNWLKITFHLKIPSRDIRYLSAPFTEKSHSYLIHVWAEMAVMSLVIAMGVIRRAFDGLTVGRALQEYYSIWQLCHIFLKSFSLISRQKALKIGWYLDQFFLLPTFQERAEKTLQLLKNSFPTFLDSFFYIVASVLKWI